MPTTMDFEQQCPLCGRNNQCGQTCDPPEQTCWCFSANIAAERLAAIPPQERGERCLCPQCAGIIDPEE